MIGRSDRSPRAATAANSGDSVTCRRIYSPTATSTELSRNGTRHPQLRNASSGNPPSAVKARLLSTSPSTMPEVIRLPQKPRRAVACSTIISAAPPHSPPVAKPCTSRSNTRSSGAAMPMLAKLGSRPMATVAPPMLSSVASSMALRPTRSPKWPQTTAPKGRATNPVAEVAKASSVPVAGSCAGKNSLPNTNAAAVL